MSEPAPFFNPCPVWMARVERFDPTVRKIAQKFVSDDSLRDDAEQEARLSLYRVRVEQIAKANVPGISEDQRETAITAYMGNVARNAILSMMDSFNTGPWDYGRTRTQTNKRTGVTRKVRHPARHSSLEHLESFGMSIDSDREIHWAPNDDGLENEEEVISRREHAHTVAALLRDEAGDDDAEAPEAPATQKAPPAPVKEVVSMATVEEGPQTKTIKHGTRKGYNHHGCRCRPCTDANNEHARAYRARRSAKAAATVPAPIEKPPTVAAARTVTAPTVETPTIREGLATIKRGLSIVLAAVMLMLRGIRAKPTPKPTKRKATKGKVAKQRRTKAECGDVRKYRSGCRCPECKKANAASERERKKRNAAKAA